MFLCGQNLCVLRGFMVFFVLLYKSVQTSMRNQHIKA
jgi:hypothetical protein